LVKCITQKEFTIIGIKQHVSKKAFVQLCTFCIKALVKCRTVKEFTIIYPTSHVG
jgi:hypothetical protein